MCAMSGELIIDLGAICQNYKILDDLSADSCETAVVVKANAYGTGAVRVVPELYKAGARSFFVSTSDEGIQIRGILPEAKIYILNGFWNKTHDVYQQYNLIPVLNSLYEIKSYQNQARRIGHALPAVLHFDTGMNRLGIIADEAKILCDDLSLLDGFDLDFIMSHFSSSDEKNSSVNIEQYRCFQKLSSCFKDVKKSLCNSGGVLLSKDYHLDITRPGIALYGGNPIWGEANIMQPVVSLCAPIIQIHSVKKGEKAGYNGIYCFDDDGDVAIVSIGYADGILRSSENIGSLYFNGHKMPIRGRISMDLVICDLSEVPQKDYPDIGDMVEVIGVHQTLDDLACNARTISYEILTSMGPRYNRIYKQN